MRFKRGFFKSVSVVIASVLVAGFLSSSPAVAAESVTAKIKTSHPYIYASSADFAAINERAKTDADTVKVRDRVMSTANRLLDLPVEPYSKPDGIRLLSVSKKIKDRSLALGMAYQLTGDTRYAERLWKELENVSKYPDWNTAHFLDTAEMTHAVAIGYDWGYNYFSVAQRDTVKNALLNKGLKPALTIYESANGTKDWLGNQNIVNNAGIGIGALAVGPEPSGVTEKILQFSTVDVKKGMEMFNPDGGFSEGVSYWKYSVEFAVYFTAALKSSTGSDYGLAASPGFKEAGLFPLYAVGPDVDNGTAFNYGDTDSNTQPYVPEFYFLGKLFNDPVYNYLAYKSNMPSSSPFALLWFDPSAVRTPPSSAGLPLDKVFSKAAVSVSSSGLNQTDATSVATKSRGELHYHDDTDVGDFVMSALGEPWAVELGKDQYTYAGLDTYKSRWDFYRKRAEGQNTMVFNAEQKTKYDQVPQQIIPFTKTASSPEKAFTVADYTVSTVNNERKASPQTAASWKRGVMLFDNRQQVLIQDEIVGSPNLTSSWWFMHTQASIQVAADGKSAVLSKPNGKKLLARLISSDSSLTFLSMPAEALPTSDAAPKETANTGYRKLAVNVKGNKTFTLAVQLTPLREDTVTPAAEKITPLSQWSVVPGERASVKDIKVDGKSLTDFSSKNLSYDVTAQQKGIPKITVDKLNTSDVVNITQPTNFFGKAKVSVTSTGKQKVTYTIFFHNTDLPVSKVTASKLYTAADVPENTLDGNTSTKWAAWKEQWIQYEFSKVMPVENLEVFWGGDGVRIFNYKILVSSDNVTWQTAASRSYPAPVGWETIPVNQSGRYVRIVIDGDSQSFYRTVNEVKFSRKLPPAPASDSVVSSIKLTSPVGPVVKGQTRQLKLVGVNNVNVSQTVAATKVVFTSTNPAVATVNSSGLVTGASAGIATVYATYFDSVNRIQAYAPFRVTVTDPNLVQVKPFADVGVQGGDKANTVLTASSILVKTTSWDVKTDRKAYFQFTIPKRDGKKIVSAQLVLYPQVAEVGKTFSALDFYAVNATVSESATTYNNRPVFGQVLGKADVTTAISPVTVDVTSYVAGKTTSYATFGVDQLSSTEKVVVSVPDRTTEYSPVLNVVFG